MTKTHSIPADAVLVALDIAKARNDVLIEFPGQARRRRITVLNTRAEHDRFIGLLASFQRPILAAFEATGNYHRAIAWRLLEAGFEARLISSMALARTREAIHNGWDKNDPKDAQVILHMLRTGMSQRYHDPLAAGISDIQELSKTHEAVSKAKTETLHRILTHYLPLYFPEADGSEKIPAPNGSSPSLSNSRRQRRSPAFPKMRSSTPLGRWLGARYPKRV